MTVYVADNQAGDFGRARLTASEAGHGHSVHDFALVNLQVAVDQMDAELFLDTIVHDDVLDLLEMSRRDFRLVLVVGSEL